ncbi:MAG: FAD-dependent oxidoreductase, partial [Phycisphaerales bacterium]|nr:FAD-dependent oxidoreductase [Phycisphaerales bacterium]
MPGTPTIAVLGGGFAGLETAFHLRYALGDAVELTLISDQDHFVFKPNTIYIPFGEDPDRFRIPLAKPTARRNIELVRGVVADVDPDRRMVTWDGGERAFDHIVVATGAAMRASEIPGLREHAVAVWTTDEMLVLRQRLNELVERARSGKRQRLLYLVPPNNRCSGPLYELILMMDTHLRRLGVREQVDFDWTTDESGYLQVFGPRLNTVV